MTLTSPGGNPLEKLDGNTGSMSYWNGVFTRVGGKLSDLRTSVQRAQDLEGVGASITAARSDATTIATALAPDIIEAELLASVLQAYADAFDSSAKRANDLIDDIETAHANWERESNTANNAGQNALWASRSADDDDDGSEAAEANEQARDAIASRDAAKEVLDGLWAEFDGHYTAWDEAYDAALAQLATGTGATLTLDARNLLDDLLGATDPAEVTRLWLEHPELHDELIAQHPDILGNLDGIPYDTRANINYERIRVLHESELDEPMHAQIEALWAELQKGPPYAGLISFDPNGSEQVTAALSYGNLDTATDVNVLVPGMNSNTAGIGEWGTSARDLNSGVGAGSATIVWFGYDSPNEVEEPSMARAEAGAASLRNFLLGLNGLEPNAEIAVIAHSYGSTTAALAIGSQPDGLGVDQFIAVGSAGFPSDDNVLANLATGPEIFATLSHDDLWARIGRDTSWGGAHGTIPETMDGVTEFDSDGGYAADGSDLAPTPGHGAHGGANGLPWQEDEGNGYLMQGTESFYNIQQIIATGTPGTEVDGAGSGGGFWDLPEWLPFNPYRF